MSYSSLEDLIRTEEDLVSMLRNSNIGAYVYPVVPPEFSNWRDEQRAWRESAALFDQSHHMAELMISGPDALVVLQELAINDLEDFPTTKAKHFVACNPNGRVIGDVILFRLGDDRFNLVGRIPAINWVEYHAVTGGHRVQTAKDDRSPSQPGGHPARRRHYRFQIQGPNAEVIIEKLNGGPLRERRFFNVGQIRIAGRDLPALNHSMVGEPGVEIWGPYEQTDEIREAILDAGEEFGIRQVGSRAYSTTALESGWIPSPLPAVYTGAEMKAYREWLPADGYEAKGSLGGSFKSDNVEDYFLTPHALGYGFYVDLNHEFIGRDSLADIDDSSQRRKVTFQWNAKDVEKIMGSMSDAPGSNFKYIEVPLSNYASSSYDAVMNGDEHVGFSMFSGYTFNDRAFISLGVVDPQVSVGDELILVWGEEDGGTGKTTVEPHAQTEIRVTVVPTPFSEHARKSYASGWRGQ